MKTNIAVIGGGASGMVAAITAARHGASVTLFERNDRLGKKILATGNGKCNLGNKVLSVDDYHSDDLEFVKRSLEQFGTEETEEFFRELGLMIKERNGYLYPRSEQASSVLDVLRMAVERYGINVVYDRKVNHLKKRKDGLFEVFWEGKKELEQRVYGGVIIACGSMAAPKTGSDGSGYKLAKQMGLYVTKICPALVQLHCKEEYCKALAGVRTEAQIHIFNGEKLIVAEKGELQMTEYGISGIPVFQLSGQVNQVISSDSSERLTARIDFLPDFTEDEWKEFVKKRLLDISWRKSDSIEEYFTGMLHKKLMLLFIKLAGLKTNMPVSAVPKSKLMEIFDMCRSFTMHITGSHSFDQAQVCSGGVSMNEVSETFEAKKVKGLYLAGEVLHVDGRCGGYNLQWAWSSGYLAGKAAAQNCVERK